MERGREKGKGDGIREEMNKLLVFAAARLHMPCTDENLKPCFLKGGTRTTSGTPVPPGGTRQG